MIRAASIAAFMMLTTAVAAHVIARAAAISGAPMWKGTLIDERPKDKPESVKRSGGNDPSSLRSH